MGLVYACANKFKGRGIEYEDLVQSGCIGLVKAAEGFDESRGFMFSTYAVPAIIGEIKRMFRDGGAVKVGRSDKEKARNLLILKDELAAKLNRSPTIGELASESGYSPEFTSRLLCSALPVLSLTVDDDEREAAETDITAFTEKVFSLAERLQQEGAKNVIVTGVKFQNRLFNVCALESGRYLCECRYRGKAYSGTGDLFASVFLGYALKGEKYENAVKKAGDFVSECIAYSMKQNIPGVHGVDFFPFLKNL